jgi:hypothetical protein
VKTTIEMAREAWEKAGEGWVHPGWFADREKALKEFEALVRADEGEACAKAVEAEAHMFETLAAAKSLAAAIRARNIK